MASVRTWYANKLSFLLYLDEEKGNSKDKRLLELLFTKCPEIEQVEILVKQFKDLFKKKEAEAFNKWIIIAQDEPPFKKFANNLLKDYDAVNNAVIT